MAQPRHSLTLRRRLLFISVPYILFIATLAAVEVWIRQTRPHVSCFEVFARTSHREVFEGTGSFQVFQGDPVLGWKLKPNLDRAYWDFTTFSTNAQSFRHDRPLGRKPRGVVRIVCLGDSVTFGYRVPVTFPENLSAVNPEHLRFTEIMQERLQDMSLDREIEVIAMAVPGYSTHQGLIWIGREIARLSPDLLVICFGWNDINLQDRPDRETIRGGWARSLLRRIFVRSQALIHGWRRLQGMRREGSENKMTSAGAVPRVSRQAYVANILEMTRLAERHGSATLVLGQLYRDETTYPDEARRVADYRKALETAMEESSIPYLAITELTEASYPGNRALFGELIHPNHLGHAVMADRILQALSEQGILGEALGISPGATANEP